MRLELTRRYAFAASHRLHSAQLDEAENQRIYGKCNNPYGHGHNYVVEVTVTGPVDPGDRHDRASGRSGRLRRARSDRAFDHTYLNKDVAAFRERVPTTENLCIEIFDRLKKFPGARLVRIRLEETGRNSFEYAGEPDGSRSMSETAKRT